MKNYTIIEILSYTANIVFITWGVVGLFKDSRRNKETANFFNAAYEMSNRLSDSLKVKYAKQQAQDLSSFLLSATMNFMSRRRNEIGKIGEGDSFNKRKKKILK
ncbi:hypothetical protein ACFL23_04245 [Patescibacteria group bacterium]